ncbi:hypothetical protein PoHVEF18_001027 [Penicillium ochrochloron]
MLRRPPNIISLTEDDLQFHLQRIFARSLPVNIDQLSLAETDLNHAEQEDPNPTTTTSEKQQPPNDTNPTGRLDQHCPLHGSTSGPSCMTRSSSTAARTPPATLPASIMNGSTHRTIVDPTRAAIPAATTAQLISSNLPQTRASRLREPSPTHARTELTIPPQEFLNRHILPSPDGKKENRRHSHPQDTLTTLNKDESRLSNSSQSSDLSPSAVPSALPDLTINLVPQRDLALAPEESYEAGLADTEVSLTVADTN